jgi:branched-chain amino acid transport system substrate-binding protein
MKLKIGLILPNSNFISNISQDISKAFQLGIDRNGSVDHELIIEVGGYNADTRIMKEKVQSLISKDEVQVIIAPMNMGMVPEIKDILGANNTTLIVNWMGEDFLSKEYQSPHVFFNTFGTWKSNWMHGYYAALNYGKIACSSVAFHEGGYTFSLAFALGYEVAGGTLKQVAITHQASRNESPLNSIQELLANEPDFVMGFYSSKEGISFLKTWAELQGKKPILMGNYPMFEEDVLAATGSAGLNGITVGSWDVESTNPINTHFKIDFESKTARRPGVFGLMAYETGLLINAALGKLSGDVFVDEKFREALKSISVEGPRGVLSFNKQSQCIETEDHLFKIEDCDRKLVKIKAETLALPELFIQQSEEVYQNLPKQGWTNPYLIA